MTLPPNPHFAASESEPQSFQGYDLARGLDTRDDDDFDWDANYGKTLSGRIAAGEPQAIVDGLRIMANFTFFNVPAMHRLDDIESLLEAAAQSVAASNPGQVERFDGLDWRGLVANE
jgi:hypothetical protein